MTRTLLSALALLATSVLPAAAQIVVPGAGEDKFGLLDGGKAITVTTGESKVGFSWSRDPKLSADDDCRQFVRGTPEYTKCLLSAVDRPQTFVRLNLAILGEKGKRTLFTDGGFTPGFEVAASLTHRIERDGSDTTGGYTDIYGGLSVSARPLSVATFADAATLEDSAEKQFGGTGGINVFLRENFGIGFAGTLTRALSTPGIQKPVTLCTTKAAGVDEDGKAVDARTCDDGFVGPLADQTVGTFRIDVLKTFTRVKQGKSGPEATATVGIIGSANVSKRSGTDPVYNIALGPTLHPKGVPHKVFLALLLKISDLTDAADQGKTFKKKASATLYFGIPLSGF